MTNLGIRQPFEELAALAQLAAQELEHRIAEVVQATQETIDAGGKLMFCGNGGSAADAQHLATEYVVRFRRNRRAAAAIALTTDTSLLTAAANDLGFDQVFARQVEALGNRGDLLFLHSTSGESENLIAAAAMARQLGIRTVAMLARGGGRLRELVDLPVVVPTENGARAQEIHLTIGHVVCDLIESRIAGER